MGIKIYLVRIDGDFDIEFVAYYKNETHIYLATIDPDNAYDRFIRIKIEDKNKKEIYDYEPYYTYTWGFNEKREYKKID
jgi:hypothetical protein